MITFVRGSRFQMMGRFLGDSKPYDTSKWQGVSVRLSDFFGEPFADLNFAWVDAPNGVARVWADDTSAWPVGRVRIDCQIVDSYGNPYNSQPDYFRLVESTLNV